jgi:hypothetical protein
VIVLNSGLSRTQIEELRAELRCTEFLPLPGLGREKKYRETSDFGQFTRFQRGPVSARSLTTYRNNATYLRLLSGHGLKEGVQQLILDKNAR